MPPPSSLFAALLLLPARRPWLSLAIAVASGGCGLAVGLLARGDGWWAVVTDGVAVAVAVAVAEAGVLAARAARPLVPPPSPPPERPSPPPLPPLLTVCAWTKQVKVDDGWVPYDRFLTDHLGLRVTHGISEEASWQMLAELGPIAPPPFEDASTRDPSTTHP